MHSMLQRCQWALKGNVAHYKGLEVKKPEQKGMSACIIATQAECISPGLPLFS